MEQNAIQKILRSEITWSITLIAFLWGVVTTVVLPLQKLQIQIAQVQLDLTAQNKRYDTLSNLVTKNLTDVNATISTVSSRTSVLESEMNNIFKR